MSILHTFSPKLGTKQKYHAKDTCLTLQFQKRKGMALLVEFLQFKSQKFGFPLSTTPTPRITKYKSTRRGASSLPFKIDLHPSKTTFSHLKGLYFVNQHLFYLVSNSILMYKALNM